MGEKETTAVMVAQDNKLTMSRYTFSPIEKRCLYYIIKEIRRLYVDSNRGQKDLFDNMYLQIPSSALKILADEVKDVYSALKRLKNKTIEIENDDVWIYTSWILQAKHDKKKDTYNIDVSKEIMPYLVELAESFTTYDLTIAISLKSTYSQRFYEYCCQYKHRENKTFFLDIDKLRFMLKVEDKKSYDNTFELKRKVLDVAQKELKELYEQNQCDIYFDYFIKPGDTEGKKVKRFWFKVYSREDERAKEINYMNATNAINRVRDILTAFFPRNKKFIQRVITELQLTPNIAVPMAEKLNNKVMDYSKKEIPAIITYVLREDYGIK